MADDGWYKPNPAPTPPRIRKPGEHVWTLVKAGRRFDCELRFQGESYGWEWHLFEDGEIRCGVRAGAENKAEEQRTTLIKDGWTPPVTSHPADE